MLSRALVTVLYAVVLSLVGDLGTGGMRAIISAPSRRQTIVLEGDVCSSTSLMKCPCDGGTARSHPYVRT